MKRKILVLLAIVSVLVVALAICVNAEGIKKFSTSEFQTGDNITYIEGIDLGAYYSSGEGKRGADITELYDSTTLARAVMKNSDGTYTTYPAYYFIRLSDDWQGDYQFVFTTRVNDMSSVTGETYTKDSFIRFEYPEVRNDHTFGKMSGNVENFTSKSLEYVYISAFYRTLNASFDRCSALKEVEFAPNSQMTSAVNFTFRQCSSLEKIVFPNTMTTFDKEVIQSCHNIKEIRLGAGVTTFKRYDSISGATSNPVKVYVPATLDGTLYGENCFPSKAVVFFTGNKAQAEAFGFAVIYSYEEYLAAGSPEGEKMIVYDYALCDAFYDEAHQMAGESTIKINSYFESILFVDSCTREGCGKYVADKSRTIEPIFTYRGYSMTEKPINGAYSVTQSYTVNREALDKYLLVNPDFKFGLVASGYSNPLGDDVDESKVVNRPGETFIFEHFEIKVNGISGENLSKSIVFCAYVIDNGTVYYLDNNKTITEINGISFKDLYAVKFEKELEI